MPFDDIIGNESIKLQLRIASKASIMKNASTPHVLFAGAAGCGKTTTAKALVKSIGSDLIKAPAEALKKTEDIIQIIEQLNVDGYDKNGEVVGDIKPSVVFIDEIHKMPLAGQEILGIAAEEWYISHKDKFTGEVLNYWVPKFTLIGATTLEGSLSKPFRDRFKLIFYFSPYELEESVKIVLMHSRLKNVSITDGGALEIAKRGRGVPRTLVGLLDNCINSNIVLGRDTIDADSAVATFEIMGIDSSGLNKEDISVLKSLYKAGSPVGIDTLSVITNISPQTIMNAKEPHLLQKGLIMRTGRGRTLTKKGRDYLIENKHIEGKSNSRFSLR